MDNYHECLVSKNRTGADKLKYGGICFLSILLAVAAILFIPITFFPFQFVIAFGIIYGGYYLMGGTNLEYEYIQTNDEIDFDKIIGRSKRKRLVTAKIKNAISFGTMDNAPKISSDYTIVEASACSEEKDYYFDFKHDSFGNVRIIFTPDEQITDAIEVYLPGPVKAEYKRQKLLNK